MRRLIAATIAAGLFAVVSASSVFAADTDPTVNQIYAAAKSGHFDEAQQMISQVLADHPNSSRAHYVQAELYTRAGKIALARSELGTAERLKPGLPEESARSVQELKAQLGLGGAVSAPVMVRQVPAQSRFPWGALLVVGGAIAILLMVFRRRTNYAQYPVAGPGMGGAPGAYGPGGYGPAPMGGGPMGGGGIGSGIAGGLASGLAVGAGVVAGEELAHHLLDRDGRSSSGFIPSAEAGESGVSNADMGGNDFGVNDPGAGWDDSSGGGGGGFDGGGGGGGDWS
jgi:hypothetical protein